MPYKIVNIEAKMKIGIVSPAIYGREKNKKMSYGEILRCLAMRATIDEVMPDGSTVRLNMSNYHHDFVADWMKAHPEATKSDIRSPIAEVKANKKEKHKNKIPTVSKETVDEVPETPATSNEKAEIPVVETKTNESADTPADNTGDQEAKSSGEFHR